MKECSKCKASKDEADFPKTGKQCKACLAEKALNRYHKNKGGGKTTRKKRATKIRPRTPDSLYTRPAGLGFTVQLEIDADTGATDIRIDQQHPESGEQRIWLNQLEAAELKSWLTEQLGAT
jgi:hypothetical protein